MKVCLTVWGSSVHEFTAEIGEIIGVKGVTVKKFNGITINKILFKTLFFR